MKRLKSKLLKMEPNTTTYTEMYDGLMSCVDPGMPPVAEYNPIYYNEDVGFEITGTHKLAQDKPTVTVIIPYDKIIKETESDSMKRLRYFLQGMDNNTATYKEMYEGKIIAFREPKIKYNKYGEEEEAPLEPEVHLLPRYWYDDMAVDIETTHKLAQDKPTVTWHIPVEKLSIENYTTAAADFCLREFKKYIDILNEALYNRSRPDNENGKYYICSPGGEVIVRNTAYFALCPQKDYVNGNGNTVFLLDDADKIKAKMCLCIRMQVQLPKRKIRKTIQMLCRDLPDAVDMFIYQFNLAGLSEAVALAEKQAAIRAWLDDSDYCAFIANGSVLPRSKGTDLPMDGAIPFVSAPGDEIEVAGVRGMGIKRGVTVITGGGYSGKSTLLDAVSAGIYDHVLGDGRELCITDRSAVTISAEDGRSVKHVNISPFIKWLPGGDTSDFSTDRASGSTSQAANIMEAVECGAKLLMIDEDRSAPNFMIRDRLMKELIEKEPITPFTDRVNELYSALGVSTILVIGGSGEYLSVADKIYMMEDYLIHDVTDRAKKLCAGSATVADIPSQAEWEQSRTLYSDGFTSYPEGSGSERLEVSDMGFIIIGDEKIDVRGLHDIVSPRQLDALGFMLRQIEISSNERKIDIDKKIDDLFKKAEKEGLDFLYSSYFTTCGRFMDMPRKNELKAVINRMRKINYIKENFIL